jgi:hypothetical protein
MSWAINDLIRVTLTWRSTVFGGVFKNILHFRGFTGEVLHTLGPTIISEIAETWLTRLYSNLSSTTHLKHIRMQNLRKPTCPDYEQIFDASDYPGQLAPTIYSHPNTAVCITRRAFRKGRKGIGHFYFGPVPDIFVSQGFAVIDPLLAGDLNDVCDALGDPLVIAGFTMRPIVHSGELVAPEALDDTRTHQVAEKAVWLKSRRPGVGE